MVEKMMILTSSYHFAEEIRTMVDWSSCGMEIVSVEYNGAIGLEQFAYFKPRIILLDSMVPIIGTDKFVEEMTKVCPDFLVILLDDLKTSISNIQNIYRVIDKSKVEPEELKQTVLDAVGSLNKNFDKTEEYDMEERIKTLQNLLGAGELTIARLQELRDNAGLLLTPQVSILLPRPVEPLDKPYSKNLLKSIWNILSENSGGEVFVMDDGVLCILINDIQSSSTERVYENLLFDLRRTLMNEYSMQWTFILSNPISLRKLEKEYGSYRELYDYGYFRSELQILKKEYIVTKSLVKKDKKSQSFYQMMVEAMTGGEDEELQAAFKMLYMDYLKKSMNMEELYLWRHALELFYHSLICLYGFQDFMELDASVFDQAYHTIEDEKEAFLREFMTLQALIQKSDKKINSLIFKIITILVEGYSGDLSLQSVAEEVNIATTYLSHLFKKEMQLTFSDYLTMIRIVAAKRMLYENRRKIHEIAIDVGFSDNRYFSRVFKKSTGISPSEYKALLEKHDEGGSGV